MQKHKNRRPAIQIFQKQTISFNPIKQVSHTSGHPLCPKLIL